MCTCAQLRLRVEASGGLVHGVLRPPPGSGSFRDLDQVRMLALLESPHSVALHKPLFNQAMFHPEAMPGTGGTRRLDDGWRDANGLSGQRYEVRSRVERSLSGECTWVHTSVHLGGARR